MKYLVTGAAGFIGSHVSRELLKRGDEVVGLDNINDYYDVNLKLARLKTLQDNASFQFEKVRHSKVGHLVYASTSSVYGAHTNMPFSVTRSVDHPLTLYAATKKANELMAHTYSNLYDLPTTGLRFFTVYGPWGRPDMALFLFTKNILAGKPIDVFNYGKHMRDFTFVEDIVEGVIRTCDNVAKPDGSWDSDKPSPHTSSAPYRVYNIGNNSPVELMEYISTLEECLGLKAELNLLPLQPGDVPATYADVSELIEDVDYKPATTVKEGVSRFVAWYREYYDV